MMKYIYIAIVSCLLFSFISCNDKLHDPLENTRTDGGIDYGEVGDMILPIRGAYGELYSRTWESVTTLPLLGDDVNPGGDQAHMFELDTYKYSSTHWMLTHLWERFYDDALTAIIAEGRIQLYADAGASQTLADQYVAECRVITAFSLFHISRSFGDIIIPRSPKATDMYEEPLTKKADVMRYIATELLSDDVINNLPDAHPADRTDIKGGATKYTALAIRAMALLEVKDYQAVANTTSEIIKSGKFVLESDFYQLFKTKRGKLNKENIFEFQYSDFKKGSGERIATPFLSVGPQFFTAKENSVSGGWGFLEPTLKYVKFMLDRNETVRLETTVLFSNRGIDSLKNVYKITSLPDFVKNTTRDGDIIDKDNKATRSIFSSGKYYVPSIEFIPGRTEWASNKNWPVIRYAEILLIHAEALTQGATSTVMSADDAVNLVRKRAELGTLSNVTLDQVLDEKFAECATEWATRYHDMVRYKKWDELSYEGRVFDESKIHMPYPQNQIDKLPQLRK